jgi:hypothetical protein
MKGFRTVLYGLAVAIVPAAFDYIGHVDWTKLGINPVVALFIGGGIIGLRAVTDTALGLKK